MILLEYCQFKTHLKLSIQQEREEVEVRVEALRQALHTTQEERDTAVEHAENLAEEVHGDW